MEPLAVALRASRPQAFATLARLLGDVDLAEDALQEACARAVSAWADGAIPDLPAAWLVRTARNHIIDAHRKRQLAERHEDAVADVLHRGEDAWRRIENDACEPLQDDLLRLVFTCCHPAMPEDARVALTLKTIAGLSVQDIAGAFLTEARTMEQRLTRAKRRIRDGGVPYETPGEEELPERRSAVLAVVYLIFNEGYKAAHGPEVMRERLASEAIRIGRLLVDLFPEDAETAGLLALMLLQHARMSARVDVDGEPIPLDDQDRSLWDRAQIREGRGRIDAALRLASPGPYQIQAAIAGVHAAASTFEETDWQEIAALYRLLERHQRSPVITLNRAVAVSRAVGPQAGLDLLGGIAGTAEMERYHHFHAVHGALLSDTGDFEGARKALARAINLSGNDRERGYLQRRLEAVPNC